MTRSWHPVILNLKRLARGHFFRSNVHRAFPTFSENSPLRFRFEHLRTTDHVFHFINKSLLKLSKKKSLSTLMKLISLRSLKGNSDK